MVTFPGFEHPDLQAAFRAPGEDLRSFLRHPVNDEAFRQALTDRRPGPCHQVGGYAAPVQGPVEYMLHLAMRITGDPCLRSKRPGGGVRLGGGTRLLLAPVPDVS
jgi:hypothetical protein